MLPSCLVGMYARDTLHEHLASELLQGLACSLVLPSKVHGLLVLVRSPVHC